MTWNLNLTIAACRLPGAVDSPSSLWEMLVEKRSGQTPKVPGSRFNIDAYFHSNLERPGLFNVLGATFSIKISKTSILPPST